MLTDLCFKCSNEGSILCTTCGTTKDGAREHFKQKPLTNVDLIRAMDIDHLIEWHCWGKLCERCPYNDVECRIRDWLQQEAE